MLANRGLRLEEATSMVQKAVNADPANGAYLDSLGWAYYKQDKLPQAEEYLEKAVAHEGHDPTILGHLGDVYLKEGQNERAAELFERSLAAWQKALPSDFRSRQGRRDRGQAQKFEEAAGAENLASGRQTAVSSRPWPPRKVPPKRDRCACVPLRKSISACM